MEEIREFNIRGKVFKISLVNNYCSRKYADEWLPKIIELGKLQYYLPKQAQTALTGKTGKAKTEELKKQSFILKEAKKPKKELEKQIREIRTELLKELLESNGYDFDEVWWEHHTSERDIDNFVVGCIKPEFEGKKKAPKK